MVFLVALFLIKNGWPWTKEDASSDTAVRDGLIYSDTTVADLVGKDTDMDGIADWEETLWGTDPNEAETTPGVPDGTVIRKLKGDQEGAGGENGTGENPENLTETDKFSRELLSTVTALNQNGVMDEVTVDKISTSLAEHIQNSTQRKIYTVADIKVVKDGSLAGTQKFVNAQNAIYTKYPINGNIVDILERFVVDENEADGSVLSELDPIIKQTRERMSAMVKIEVPEYFSLMYVNLLNTGEKVVENLEDIRFYETDPIIALGGIAQYEKSTADLEESIGRLMNAINEILSN